MESMSSHIPSIVFNTIALTHSNENVTKSRDGCTQSIDEAKLDSLQKTTEVTVQTLFTEHGNTTGAIFAKLLYLV